MTPKKQIKKTLCGCFGSQVIKMFPFVGPELPQTTYLQLR